MKLLNKKLNRMQWINKGILLFILLFAFEPILSSSNIYWYLLAVSASIVFLIFIGFILGIFIKKIPIKNNLINEGKISYGYLLYNPQIEIVSPAETKQYFNIFILKNEMV